MRLVYYLPSTNQIVITIEYCGISGIAVQGYNYSEENNILFTEDFIEEAILLGKL